MAEERNLATVRATETPDGDDVSKEELQRRMEEARESITQTVAEIKDTVANQYQAVRETVTEALDWREQFRKRPVAFSVGALSIGFCVGYSLAGAFKGDGRDYYDYDEEGESATSGADYYARGESQGETVRRKTSPRSYAAQAITGSSYGSPTGASSLPPSPAAYSSGAAQASSSSSSFGGAEAEEDQGPGLIERFKSTKAYDRLEEEVSALGDRFINELSKTAQTVVLPALFGKVKELFGFDLSGKEGEGRTSAQQYSGGSSSSGSTTGGSAGQESSGGGSSYATSENRGYGAAAGGDYRRGSD
ncbi:MAG TPA: hypothetical protein VE842_19630 [Pyrinomonadaceae bacterium]|jgi:uncharacterized membrane protein YgcG|nr:hypothetical protein [Pyrinomonadaceae bacterium]